MTDKIWPEKFELSEWHRKVLEEHKQPHDWINQYVQDWDGKTLQEMAEALDPQAFLEEATEYTEKRFEALGIADVKATPNKDQSLSVEFTPLARNAHIHFAEVEKRLMAFYGGRGHGKNMAMLDKLVKHEGDLHVQISGRLPREPEVQEIPHPGPINPHRNRPDNGHHKRKTRK